MKIIHAIHRTPEATDVVYITRALARREIIVFPTDTSYGLGADATDQEAIKKVFAIKGRDYKKPLHIIVSDIEMAQKYASITPFAKKLFLKFLPGPVTFVVPKKKNLPDLLTAGFQTVGIRMPNHPIPNMIVKAYGKPITATSANVSGEPDRYDVEDIDQEFARTPKPDLVIDAGTLPRVSPSTIIAIENNAIRLLRKGPLAFEAVEKFIQAI